MHVYVISLSNNFKFLKRFFRKIVRVIEIVENVVILLARKIIGLKKRRVRRKILLRDIVFVCIALVFIVFGGGLLWFSSIEIPDLASFDKRLIGQSSKIFDRTGTILLYDLGQNMRRTVVPFENISTNIKNATVAIEDSEFYRHGGIKLSAILRAFYANLASLDFSQGGSTITQQVVKNSLLTREKTITRKIKEIFLAVKLEKNLTKDQILNLYLNESPYGGTIYGVEEASQVYFGKSATDLDIVESAYLASIPKSPTYYSPYGNHKDDLDNRKNLTLLKMKESGFISDEEYEEAKNKEVHFREQVSGGIKAPHFVMFIRDYLEEHYGGKMIAEGGLNVTTTLDYEFQKTAEEIVKRKAIENGKLYHATNAALVAIDAKTGQILTMVGSRDYFDTEVDGNYNVATAKRQPGSSFKPFVYAQAFNMGYRPETILFDLPIQFTASCDASNLSSEAPCYSPSDYDGKFRGPISIRNALAQSINVPAVQMLYLVGVNNAIDLAEKMGITTLADRSRFGLSLVLGGGEVTLLDMTGAYSVFATQGVKHPTTPILKIEDRQGKILEEWEDQGNQVLPKDTTLLISDILSDNEARTPVFTARSSLYFPDRQVAAKTGTTNNYRDAWVVGYTPQISVGAWAGNNDNSPIDRKVAGYIVAPMWHEFMNEILKTLPDERFEKPEEKDLSELKPILRGEWRGNEAMQNPDGTITPPNGVHSILFTVDKNDPLGPLPKNPAKDPQFSHWEYAVQLWASQNVYGSVLNPTAPPQNQTGPLSVSIVSPQNNVAVANGSVLNIVLNTISNSPILKANYFLDGTLIGTSTSPPYGFSFTVDDTHGVIGQNTVKVVLIDQGGAQSEATLIFVKQEENQ